MVVPLLAFLSAVSVACTDEESPASDTASPSGFPSGITPATVTRVVDGDTIKVELDGQEYTVRYIGIDTPESVDPRRPVECFGKEASEFNERLVGAKTVGLEKDISETDDFGRLLRYVWLDGHLVNARLVSEGFALASTYPPDVRYSDLFAQLQNEAREAGRGLWGAACEPTPSPSAAAAQGSGPCEFSNSTQAMIKGNISRQTGEKIYHVPGDEFYDETVIDEAAGERWFCTEADAVSAGWRPALR